MNREYHRWYSSRLNRDMETLVFGHGGMPLIVFPTSMGRYYEYEDRNMIGVLAPKIDRGELQVFCPDAVDLESWYNKGLHPRQRVERAMQYDSYLVEEYMPFLRGKNWSSQRAVTGCSFGGYEAINFAFKHPDLVTHVVSMSGAFDIHQFLDGYYDQDCYYSSPTDYLPNMTDEWYLNQYRQMKIVLAAGDWDICLGHNMDLSNILNRKGVPNSLDIWGEHQKHDWPLWERMAAAYF